MDEPHDDSLLSTVHVKIAHGVAHRVVKPEASKLPFEVGEAEDCGRLAHGPARCSSEESGDGGGNAGNGPHAAGNFFNVNAWKSRCDWHGIHSSKRKFNKGRGPGSNRQLVWRWEHGYRVNGEKRPSRRAKTYLKCQNLSSSESPRVAST